MEDCDVGVWPAAGFEVAFETVGVGPHEPIANSGAFAIPGCCPLILRLPSGTIWAAVIRIVELTKKAVPEANGIGCPLRPMPGSTAMKHVDLAAATKTSM